MGQNTEKPAEPAPEEKHYSPFTREKEVRISLKDAEYFRGEPVPLKILVPVVIEDDSPPKPFSPFDDSEETRRALSHLTEEDEKLLEELRKRPPAPFKLLVPVVIEESEPPKP